MNLDIFRREFANGTITGSDVFTAIWLQDGPLSLSELAETLRVSTRTVQRSLGRLARAGLVEKRTYNKRQPCRDEWELTATTRMALDRSGSLSTLEDLENRDQIDQYDSDDRRPQPEQEALVIKVTDCLCLPQSLTVIREAVLSVPEMAPEAVMAVAKRVASYIWREDGTANRSIEKPAAYFAKSLKKEWEGIQQYFQAKKEAGLEGHREIHTTTCREESDREEGVTVQAAHQDTYETEADCEPLPNLRAQRDTEVVVAPSGRVMLVFRREDKPKSQEARQGKRVPGMFSGLAQMLKRRVVLDSGETPIFGVAAAAGT